MAERLLVVSDDLIDRVDALRDGKSREQFLELAVLLVGELDRVRGDRARLEFLQEMREQLEAQERRIRELEQVTIGFLRSLEGTQAGWSVSSACASPTVTAGTPLSPTATGAPLAAGQLAAAQQAAGQMAAAQQAAGAQAVPQAAAPAAVVIAPAASAQPEPPGGAAQPAAPAAQPPQQALFRAPAREDGQQEVRRREALWQELGGLGRSEARGNAGPEDGRVRSPSRKRAGGETPAEAYNRAIFNTLWLVAALLYGFGDTLTSYLIHAAGGREANPIMHFFMQLGGMAAFVAGKTLIMAGLFAFSVFVSSPLKRSGWLIPIATALVGAYLVVHNVIVLFSR